MRSLVLFTVLKISTFLFHFTFYFLPEDSEMSGCLFEGKITLITQGRALLPLDTHLKVMLQTLLPF